MESPGISTNERLVIERNQSSSVGIASAVIAAGRPAIAAATAVAALTCEALQAQVILFGKSLTGLEKTCMPCMSRHMSRVCAPMENSELSRAIACLIEQCVRNADKGV